MLGTGLACLALMIGATGCAEMAGEIGAALIVGAIDGTLSAGPQKVETDCARTRREWREAGKEPPYQLDCAEDDEAHRPRGAAQDEP